MKSILWLLFVALAFVGCGEPIAHYDRVQGVSVSGGLDKVSRKQQGTIRPYGSVKFFSRPSDVPSRYDVLAIMTVAGSPQDEGKFIRAFLYRAADYGADAVVMDQTGSYLQEHPGIGLAGSGGAIAVGGSSDAQVVYRALAIRFSSSNSP